jgi:hypothetical protein
METLNSKPETLNPTDMDGLDLVEHAPSNLPGIFDE